VTVDHPSPVTPFEARRLMILLAHEMGRLPTSVAAQLLGKDLDQFRAFRTEVGDALDRLGRESWAIHRATGQTW
jgi:hypothetical protein